MTDKTDIEMLRSIFDVNRPDFPLEEICLSVPNQLGRLFAVLARGIIRECKSKVSEPGTAVWTNPMTRQDLLSIYDERLCTSDRDTRLKNFRDHLNRLHAFNMIYGCGIRESMIFMVEPNVLSWAPFSHKPMVYPETMLSMLRSRRAMFGLITSGLVERKVSTKSILEQIALFFSGLAKKMDPSIMAHDWDGIIDPESYCRQLERTMKINAPLKGLKMDYLNAACIEEKLLKRLMSPINSSKFNELLPQNEDVTPRQKKINRDGMNPKYNRAMTELDKIPTESLDLVGGGMLHLLQCFQRFVLPEIGMPSSSYRMFQNYGQEEMYAENIKNTLINSGKFNREVILSWINWFAMFKARSIDVMASTCALKLLFSSWNEFSTLSEGAAWTNIVSQDDFPSDGPIFNRMLDFVCKATDERWFEECAMRYGFIMTYAFLTTRMSDDVALANIRTHFDTVQNHIKTDEGVRSRFMKAMRQTMIRDVPEGYKNRINSHWGFLLRYPELKEELLFSTNNADVITLDDLPTREFWSVVEGKKSLKSEVAHREKSTGTKG